MTQPTPQVRRSRWAVWGAVVTPLLILGGFLLVRGPSPRPALGQEPGEEAPPAPAPLYVEVTTPQRGGMERTTTQPGTVQSYESAQLVAEVSGYLKTLTVDIGDRVKRGQVVAKSGQSGNVTSPQLHFEIRKGSTPVDPVPFLDN